jgi:hypothetical protein
MGLGAHDHAERSSACVSIAGRMTAMLSIELPVRQHDEDQDATIVSASRNALATPFHCWRLPHSEPFAAEST